MVLVRDMEDDIIKHRNINDTLTIKLSTDWWTINWLMNSQLIDGFDNSTN